jgi:hypothetical protein
VISCQTSAGMLEFAVPRPDVRLMLHYLGRRPDGPKECERSLVTQLITQAEKATEFWLFLTAPLADWSLPLCSENRTHQGPEEPPESPAPWMTCTVLVGAGTNGIYRTCCVRDDSGALL